MDELSILKKLKSAPGAAFEVLDVTKSKRMGGVNTLYIPSVADVAGVIQAIPEGETKTIEDLRNDLAKIAEADTACPSRTIKYWKWMASLSEDYLSENPHYRIPWWRVLKDGRPSRHMPGGCENQILLLKAEGVSIR